MYARTHDRTKISYLFFRFFIPFFFLGLILLALTPEFIPSLRAYFATKNPLALVCIAFCHGLLLGMITLALYAYSSHRYHKRPGHWFDCRKWEKRHQKMAVVGFMCGVCNMLIIVHVFGLFLITLLVLWLVVQHIKFFLTKVIKLLKPDTSSTWNDLGQLVYIYLTMIIAFTLLNASLQGLHILTHMPSPAFSFIEDSTIVVMDAFYFSVVVVTTLGFGDISPLSMDAKLLVAFETITGYFMFALMIGIITRGISPEQNSRE